MADSKKPSAGFTSLLVIRLMAAGQIVVLVCMFQDPLHIGYRSLRLAIGHELVNAEVKQRPGEYQFFRNGQRYTGLGVGLDWNEVVTVAYLPSDPNVNRPAHEILGDVVFGLIIFTGVFLLVIAFLNPSRLLDRRLRSKREQEQTD